MIFKYIYYTSYLIKRTVKRSASLEVTVNWSQSVRSSEDGNGSSISFSASSSVMSSSNSNSTNGRISVKNDISLNRFISLRKNSKTKHKKSRNL